MSLYIGALAFPGADPLHQAQVRAGVVLGSLASIALGLSVLLFRARRRARDDTD
jgi:Na+/H+ antiporter NhaA